MCSTGDNLATHVALVTRKEEGRVLINAHPTLADPLAIGWLRDFAAKPLDVCATMVLIIDVPRQALSIVLAHHRAIAENASAATLAAKDEGKFYCKKKL